MLRSEDEHPNLFHRRFIIGGVGGGERVPGETELMGGVVVADHERACGNVGVREARKLAVAAQGDSVG